MDISHEQTASHLIQLEGVILDKIGIGVHQAIEEVLMNDETLEWHNHWRAEREILWALYHAKYDEVYEIESNYAHEDWWQGYGREYFLEEKGLDADTDLFDDKYRNDEQLWDEIMEAQSYWTESLMNSDYTGELSCQFAAEAFDDMGTRRQVYMLDEAIENHNF